MKEFTIILSFLAMVSLVLFCVFKPKFDLKIKNKKLSFQSFWVVVSVFALIIFFVNIKHSDLLFDSLIENNSVNPIKILVLFLSLSVVSILLDVSGFFKMCVKFSIKHVNGSKKKLFFSLFFIVSLLTVFTSNDIVILTFTPFICLFCQNRKINPLPYLILEFVMANTFSMMLVIGNPTNIYISQMFNIKFFDYTLVMLIPTFAAGLTALSIIYMLFKKELNVSFSNEEDNLVFEKNNNLIIVGLVHLIVCTILLILSNYFNFEMWLCAFLTFISLFVYVLVYDLINKTNYLINVLKKVSYSLIPFLISMFTIVFYLNFYGVTEYLANILCSVKVNTIFTFGTSSIIFANLINNIPMSVLFSNVLSYIDSSILNEAVYSTIIGSNLGAFLTPVGALAGIMWMSILKEKGVKLSFLKFMIYGIIIIIPTFILCALCLMFLI